MNPRNERIWNRGWPWGGALLALVALAGVVGLSRSEPARPLRSPRVTARGGRPAAVQPAAAPRHAPGRTPGRPLAVERARQRPAIGGTHRVRERLFLATAAGNHERARRLAVRLGRAIEAQPARVSRWIARWEAERDPQTRDYLLLALGGVRTPEVRAWLLSRFEDRGLPWAERLAAALAALQELDPVLRGKLRPPGLAEREPWRGVRIGTAGPGLQSALLREIEGGAPAASRRAVLIGLLGASIDQPGVAGRLRGVYEASGPTVRAAVVRELGASSVAGAQAWLRLAVESDRSLAVRRVGLLGLDGRRPENRRLLERMVTQRSELALRGPALARLVDALPSDAAIERLAKVLREDADPGLRAQATLLLVGLRPAEAARRLLHEAHGDRSPLVRRLAREATGRGGPATAASPAERRLLVELSRTLGERHRLRMLRANSALR